VGEAESRATGENSTPEKVILRCLFFGGFGGRKFSVAMGFGARGPRVQFTDFSDGCPTGVARHSQYLLWGEIFRLHKAHHAMFHDWNLLNIAHSTVKISTAALQLRAGGPRCP
jgi:hypothetical protein